MSSPLTLPLLGCGTWSWGNRLLWGYDQSMDPELAEVFKLCVDQGATLFDTGDSYGTGKLQGRSEILLGRFAQNCSADICLATKLAPYPWRLTRQSMVRAAAASAGRLGRPIDLVQMHWSTGNYAPWQESALLNGLGDLYDQGLVRGVGLSNYGPQRLKKVLAQFQAREIPIISLQVQYSLLSTYPVTQLGLKDFCDQRGIKLIAYSPLALGLLTGKYADKGPYPPGIRGLLFRQLLPGITPVLDCLKAIALSRNKTMTQVALNWCICKGTIPIPGAKTVEQAKDNLGALGWHLDDGEVSTLDQATTKVNKTMVQNIFQTN